MISERTDQRFGDQLPLFDYSNQPPRQPNRKRKEREIKERQLAKENFYKELLSQNVAQDVLTEFPAGPFLSVDMEKGEYKRITRDPDSGRLAIQDLMVESQHFFADDGYIYAGIIWIAGENRLRQSRHLNFTYKDIKNGLAPFLTPRAFDIGVFMISPDAIRRGFSQYTLTATTSSHAREFVMDHGSGFKVPRGGVHYDHDIRPEKIIVEAFRDITPVEAEIPWGEENTTETIVYTDTQKSEVKPEVIPGPIKDRYDFSKRGFTTSFEIATKRRCLNCGQGLLNATYRQGGGTVSISCPTCSHHTERDKRQFSERYVDQDMLVYGKVNESAYGK